MLVCGDFNAKTGGLSNQISHDSVRVNFSDCPRPQNYISDQTKSRNQLHVDTKSNLNGKLLTDICKSHNLRILNGRFLGDSLGYFTFFNSNSPVRARGLSRECVLRIPSVIVKGD